MVFGDEAEDDDGSFELVHETVSPPHAWSAGQPSMPRSQHGSSQPSLRSLRLCLATMVETNKGQPTDIGIDLTEQALTELAEEKGISKEELRSLLDASTASTAPSTSSASPVATLRPAKRSSTPVQLLPAASSSSSSAMAMAPTQQRMVIPAGESEEEKAEEPKEEATEPAEETKLEEVNQEEAEPLVPAEKEKKYRRIRVKKSYPKIVTGVKREATSASSSRVVLTREQRLERLRRLQHDRQERRRS